MLLVDVHAHLDMPAFMKDLPNVVERARNAGVVSIISQGVHHASNERTLALAARYPIVHAALGLYPLDAPNVTVHEENADDYDRSCAATVAETIKQIKAHAQDIVAIGEVGMDLKYSDDEQHQAENFLQFVRLANQLGKPLIIHSRKAEKHVLDILEDAGVRNAVLHCFSGSRKLIRRAVELGLRLTVTANANRLQHFQMLAREVPLGQLLTETDAPYLSPVRGERNEPQNVRVAVETIAQQKRLNVDEVARNIFLNYQRTF